MIGIFSSKTQLRKRIKKQNVKFDNIPKANEENVQVTNGSIRITDKFQFFSSTLDSSGKRGIVKNHKTLKRLKM